MLFGYPSQAIAENWMHESLSEIVRTIHAKLDAGEAIPKWPDIIPAAHRADLLSRRGLRDRLKNYENAAKRLSTSERQRVLTCLDQQNRIADLVSCTSECECLNDLPEAIRKPVEELFGFAFELLTALGVRDRHYQVIYSSAAYHVCPFCGCEYFDAPGGPREDLDHYLPKSIYPFAAANLRNLAPMGMKCNERYKQWKDILRDAAGKRRRAFDPYGDQTIKISLDGSVAFPSGGGQIPNWHIEFDPDSPECTTWDDVFAVRERIERDVLTPSFHRWLVNFAKWFKRRMGPAVPSDAVVLDAIHKYLEDLALMGLSAQESFRLLVFRMLYRHYRQGDPRLIAFMRDLVTST